MGVRIFRKGIPVVWQRLRVPMRWLVSRLVRRVVRTTPRLMPATVRSLVAIVMVVIVILVVDGTTIVVTRVVLFVMMIDLMMMLSILRVVVTTSQLWTSSLRIIQTKNRRIQTSSVPLTSGTGVAAASPIRAKDTTIGSLIMQGLR